MSRLKKRKQHGYSHRNRVQLVKGGKDYFDTLDDIISKTLHSIHLQFYIFLDDETGNHVIDSLAQAAKRGVAIYLHLDAYASQGLSKHGQKKIKDSGIKLKWFEPLFKSRHFYFGRRMHHKVVVADGLFSLVGGVNICNRYNDMPGEPPWLDMAIYCEGEASFGLYRNCIRMWGNKKMPAVNWEIVNEYCKHIPENEQVTVRVRKNDWVKTKTEITKSYLGIFNAAEKKIMIMCSYFLPGPFFRKRLAVAVKRGVNVQVILAGNSDVMVAKYAERYLYEWLLKNGIEIFEYQDSVLHAKVAVCDEEWVTVGSYNVNNISAHASLEVNIDVKDRKFALSTEEQLNNIILHNCKKINLHEYEISTNWFKKFWQMTSYYFINIVLKLFTFYFRQEE